MAPSTQVGPILQDVRRSLRPLGSSTGREAQLLVAEAVGQSQEWVLAHGEAHLRPEQSRALEYSVSRFLSGEPLPYVLGWWEFFGRRFLVTPQVLIPRPETEGIVEAGLEFLRRRSGQLRILDVGTGSGCLAVTLAAESPCGVVIASDLSPGAVGVARRNALAHQVQDRVHLLLADLLPPLRARADLLVANLPYIPRLRLAGLDVSRAEPWSALDGGRDGLDFIRRLVGRLPYVIARGGRAIMEIDFEQASQVLSMVGRRLPSWTATVRKDLAGLNRLVILDRRDQR